MRLIQPVLRRFGIAVGLFLLCVQPMSAQVIYPREEIETYDENHKADQDKVTNSFQASEIVRGLNPEQAVMRTPFDTSSPFHAPRQPAMPEFYPPTLDFEHFDEAFAEESSLPPIRIRPLGQMGVQPPAVQHRGELVLDPSVFPRDVTFFAYGPDTPPPSAGDWVVDEQGNNVNNTTIWLNGSLRVTTGDLTLDNVTLIINCTSDGQYGINISSGGTLNVTNTCITAFNGSLHYKFAVYGNMDMDRCNVSEMWGNSTRYWEGSGIAIFLNGTIIRSSTISNGSADGIQVWGLAAPEILDVYIKENNGTGILSLDNSAPVIRNCTITKNYGNGICILNSSNSRIINCTFADNDPTKQCFPDIVSVGDSAPYISDCSIINASTGIFVRDNSTPSVSNCVVDNASFFGIAAGGCSKCCVALLNERIALRSNLVPSC